MTIRIHLILHGLLRDRLPPDARGRADLDLPDSATLAHLRAQLNIPDANLAGLNGQIQRDPACLLHDGDEVRFFRAAGGGAPSDFDPPGEPHDRPL